MGGRRSRHEVDPGGEIAILRLPFAMLASIIRVLCLVGGYAQTRRMFDVRLMLVFGLTKRVLKRG